MLFYLMLFNAPFAQNIQVPRPAGVPFPGGDQITSANATVIL
jgi:hypothetical protein